MEQHPWWYEQASIGKGRLFLEGNPVPAADTTAFCEAKALPWFLAGRSRDGAVVGQWWSPRALPAARPWGRWVRIQVPGAAAWVRMDPSHAWPAAGRLLAAGNRTLQGHRPQPQKAKCLLLRCRAPGDTRVSDWHLLIGTCN